MALVYGDLLMRMLYRVRPYETEPGAADALCDAVDRALPAALARPGSARYPPRRSAPWCRTSTRCPSRDGRKPRVGVVGEILVKFHPTANNRIVGLIESEGRGGGRSRPHGLPALRLYRATSSGAGSSPGACAARSCPALAIAADRALPRPQKRALAASRRFHPPRSIYELARGVDGIVQLGNVTGEGWFLTAEMVELIESGVNAIACIQPFACLPNHVTGKGMIRELRRRHPEVTIAAIDYDPGASEVNQLNRLKLLLASAREALEAAGNPTRQRRPPSSISTAVFRAPMQ